METIEMNVYIYTLEHPITKEIRYVGKTKNLEERLKNHINKAHNKNSHKTNWIESLKKKGLRPILKVVEEVPNNEWRYWEKFWISIFKSWGFRLVNHTSGGEGASFANKGSFKKGMVPWNKNKGNTEICPICNEEFKIYKSNSIRGRKACSLKCGVRLRIPCKDTQFKKGQVSLNRKTVYQYSKDKNIFIGEFKSVRNASESLNLNEVAIARCCRSLSKSSGGYFWTYNKLIKE